MIHSLIEFSLKNRFLVIAFYLGMGGWGWWALSQSPVDAIPDLSDNQVIVFTDWTGRSPQEVEDQVSAELGQSVKRGQVIAQLFSRELAEAQSAFVGFQAQLEAEQKKLIRAQELVRLGATSREELESVEASHQVHTAHLEEACQRLFLLGLTESQVDEVRTGRTVSSGIAIPAPIDGIMTVRNNKPGTSCDHRRGAVHD